MFTHTLILSTTKRKVSKEHAFETIIHLINQGLLMVEYFGIELDNPTDYVSADMQEASKEITYIEIHFSTNESIDYDSLNEIEVDKFIINLLESSTKNEIRIHTKDVTIFLQ